MKSIQLGGVFVKTHQTYGVLLSQPGPPDIAEPSGSNDIVFGQVGWHREQSAPRPNQTMERFLS
ncbi:hypothetical protein [Alicyclobacillus fodiniaquatilis]|uniref:Uncharacterized protein n=1 Tax=Alicyclobacillus fodiniaquatilis TaxID=1661150 RepID=A0ABW4JGN4_9BACL